MRAVSTVLDATLCLLLISASALTLAGTPGLRGTEHSQRTEAVAEQSADETAEMLATTTAQVSYAVGDHNRTAHDTLAGLLASAARVDARIDSSRTPSSTFVQAVTDEVGRALDRPGIGTQVWVQWSPSRNASSNGRLVVGESPQPDTDVHAAELAIQQVRLTVRTWSR